MITHEKFMVEGMSLAARLYLPDDKTFTSPFRGVVMYHGYGGRRKRYGSLARDLMARGIAVLAFDFRGCGESEGDFEKLTIADHLKDAVAGYDFLCSHEKVHSDRIGILGVSYGAYLGAIVSGQAPVTSMLLDAPAMYDDEWVERTVRFLPTQELKKFREESDFSAMKPIVSLCDYDGHLMVVRHELDQQMPSRIADAYMAAAPRATSKEECVMVGLDHPMTEARTGEFSKIVCEWFAGTLK